MPIPLTWSFSQSWLRMLLSMAYFTKRMSRLSMRKLRSPNQNTRLWVGGRATGWKGRGYGSRAAQQGENILSLQHRRSQKRQRRSALSQPPGQLPALPGFFT